MISLRPIATFLVLAVLSGALLANTFVIRDIRVEGLQRIAAGTVFAYMPYEVGDRVDGNAAAEIIRSLYATGFFKDVQLRQEGSVLIVSVIERPAIASISFTGNKDIKEDALREGLRSIGFTEGRVFNELLLDRVKQDLKSQYYDRGKYGVVIESVITPLERNRVAVDLVIREGRTARIKEINIVGNEAYKERTLQRQLSQSTGGIFARFTKEDRYSRQKMLADIETLRSYYLDRGYLQFDVESTQVSISPNKEDIFLTMSVKEGDVYTVSDVQLAGKTIVAPEDLFPLIHLRRGEPFSRKLVVRSAERLTNALSDQGYAFAKVNPIPTVDEENKTVAVTFFIEPGRRVYVRRIEIRGNTRSRDRVLRREFSQLEASWYSAAKVNESRERLLRLGFFDKVEINTIPVAGAPDQIDIEVTVEEKRSGELMAGVGYSQSGGVSLQARISEENFFGTGKKVSLGFNTSDVNTFYELSYTNPYFTVDGVSQGFFLRYQETDTSRITGSVTIDYVTDTGEVGVNFGFPITQNSRITVGGEVEFTKLKPVGTSSPRVTNFIGGYGDSFTNFHLSAFWSYDTRNRAFFPTQGSRISAGIDVAVPGSDLTFWTLNYSHRTYVPVWESYALSGRLDVSYGEGYGDSSKNVFPLYKYFFAGGPGSVRGYQAFSLGPRDPDNLTKATGGNLRLTGSAELWFPPPFMERADSVRFVGFFDFGNVFNTNSDFGVPKSEFSADELRTSVGIGMSWLSPVGLLNLSFAQPLNDKPGDDVEEFQFTFGTRF